MVFLVAGIIGAVCELVIGYLVDNTRTKLGKVKPWVGLRRGAAGRGGYAGIYCTQHLQPNLGDRVDVL